MSAKPVLHVEASAEPAASLRLWWLALVLASLAGWAALLIAAATLIHLVA